MLKNYFFQKKSHFRHWVFQQWDENKKERIECGIKPLTLKEYCNNYKYWLKQEYKKNFKNP